MVVVLDTSVFVGGLHAPDPQHGRARELLKAAASRKHGAALAPDAVVVEALTFLRRRPGQRAVSQAFADLVDQLRVLPTTTEVLDEARALHFREWDRRLSLVDCIVIEQARRLEGFVATLESGWGGLVGHLA